VSGGGKHSSFYDKVTIMAVKRFIVHAPGFNVINTFNVVINVVTL
jgi:hypothetical protein